MEKKPNLKVFVKERSLMKEKGQRDLVMTRFLFLMDRTKHLGKWSWKKRPFSHRAKATEKLVAFLNTP